MLFACVWLQGFLMLMIMLQQQQLHASQLQNVALKTNAGKTDVSGLGLVALNNGG